MQVKIKEIANIQFGYYGQPSKVGTIPYLQAKHFNEFGQYIAENDTFLEEDPKATTNLLQDGDVLFVAKPARSVIVVCLASFGQAVLGLVRS